MIFSFPYFVLSTLLNCFQAMAVNRTLTSTLPRTTKKDEPWVKIARAQLAGVRPSITPSNIYEGRIMNSSVNRTDLQFYSRPSIMYTSSPFDADGRQSCGLRMLYPCFIIAFVYLVFYVT